MAKSSNRQVSLDSRRIELERATKIRVPQFDNFVTEYSGNISTTGMFIVSETPPPVGTALSFEFSVADDWKLIRGNAQVVWVRSRSEGTDRPSGMGIRFVELDAQSRRLIRWMVEKHIREGGKPFELDELRSVIDEALVDVLDSDELPAASPAIAPAVVPAGRRLIHPSSAQKTSTVGKQLAPLILTAVGVIGAVLALFWLTEFLSGKSAQEVAATVAAGESTGEPENTAAGSATHLNNSAEGSAEAGSGSVAGSVESTAPADRVIDTREASNSALRPASEEAVATLTAASQEGAAPIGSAYRGVVLAVDSWAQAWSDQDVNAYLSYYSTDFRPPGGISRSQWSAQRRERLGAPRFVKVAVSGLETERVDLDHVRATFFQSYRSDRYADSVQKTLELVWEDGTWKIRRELS